MLKKDDSEESQEKSQEKSSKKDESSSEYEYEYESATVTVTDDDEEHLGRSIRIRVIGIQCRRQSDKESFRKSKQVNERSHR
jgi:hypothetical protein